MTRTIPLYTLAGVPDCETSTHYIATGDGLGLSLLRFRKGAAKDVVMIAHGLTTSSDMFIMPEHENLVRFLHAHGFPDVWCFDFRMSNRHPYNLTRHRYTMDHVGLFDFPPAIDKIREVAGQDVRIHVIAHCLGSVSFMLGLYGGAIKGVSSAIANSVALTPRVPNWSRFKLKIAPFLLDWVINEPYLSPKWGEEHGLTPGKIVSKGVDLFHRECDNKACHMLSFMWGTGYPALYSHDKLHPVTHERGGDLYGPTSPNYYRHVNKMVAAGHAVKFDAADPLLKPMPDDYLARAGEVTTPVLFTTGDKNNVFRDSNIVCFDRLEKVTPGLNQLAVFESYGHQDVFMGKDVARDVFPRLVDFISRHAGSGAASREAAE